MRYLLGLLGHPLGHSLSPVMHRAALRALGLEGDYRRLDTPSEQLGARVEEVRTLYHGVNVTVPHKEAILPWLDELDPAAAAIGAVNTVVNDGGRLVGHNTDAPGFLRALAEAGVRGEVALLLGAGGAARAIAFALKEAGWEVWIHNRTRARALALAEAFGLRVVDPARAREADLVVNATSVGLHDPDATPIDPCHLPRGGAVVDIIYGVGETRLLRAARARGLPAFDGLGMLLWQGLLAFELWTGRKAPVEAVRRALLQAVHRGGNEG